MMRCYRLPVALAALVSLWTALPPAGAQVVTRPIGGVSVDPAGALRRVSPAEQAELLAQLRQQLATAPTDLLAAVPQRKISLRALQAELRSAQETGQPIPDDVRYLAGLLRVEYVFAYPEQQDIVLVGPAEGWHAGPTGDVVGVTSGLPVLQLDDLLVALRSTQAARQEGITCSIDPTPAGRQALDAYLRQQANFHPGVTHAIAQALGPQTITVTGVPEESHFARVLVASDYRMKALAMQLEPSHLPELPSFLELLKKRSGGLSNLMPRWWMACDYETIARTEDRLCWQIRGQGIKVMTEDELVSQDGQVQGTGRTNRIAQEWAQRMTLQFPELARQTPVFGQLRNLMDLCLVAAIIDLYQLADLAQCDLSLLQDAQGSLATQKWDVPKQVPSHSSFVKKGRQYVIAASGGVQIDAWHLASQAAPVAAAAIPRPSLETPRSRSWCWD